MNERKISWIVILLICSAAFGIYSGSLPYSFTYDDHHYIEESRYIKRWGPLIQAFASGYSGVSPEELDLSRPLMPVSLALDYSFRGLDPSRFRLTNILFHVLNSVLVYILACYLIGDRRGWLLAALIFSLHPIHVEPVVGITFREDLLVTFFFLSSLLLYIKSAEDSKNPSYILSLVSFILALLSKEMAVTLPVALLLCDRFILRPKGKKGDWSRHLPYWTVIPFYLLFLYLIYSRLPGQGVGWDLSASVLSAPKMIASYSGLLLFPFNLHVDYDLNASWSGPGFAAGLIILSAAGFYIMKGKDRALSFCIALLLATLVPVMNIIPTFRLMADRFLYLPSAVFSIMAGMLIIKVRPGGRFITVVSSVLFLLLGAASVKRGTVWKSDFTLWSDVMKKSPASVRASTALGAYLLKDGKTDDAISMLQKAVSLRPDYDKAHYNLGVAYMRLGLMESAVSSLKRAVEITPGYAKARFQLGLALSKSGRFGEAAVEYEKALEYMPDNPIVYNNLGNAFSSEGDYGRAIAAYERAIAIDPDYADAWFNMGNLRVRLNDAELALKAYHKAAELDHENAGAFFNMGMVYQAIGDRSAAAAAYREALKIDPSHQGAVDVLRVMEQNSAGLAGK